MTARDIERLVRRHSIHGEVFSEVTLPSGRRMDLVEVRGQGRHEIIGYETKVSRGDFLSDDKWPDYLPYCNQLWFVAPIGVITADDLQDTDAGLLVVTEKELGPPGRSRIVRKLWQQRRARLRQIDPSDANDVLFRIITLPRKKVFT